MGIFNLFERVKDYTPEDKQGLWEAEYELDLAVPALEKARDDLLRRAGLSTHGEMAIANTPDTTSVTTMIDQLAGFETPPADRVTTTEVITYPADTKTTTEVAGMPSAAQDTTSVAQYPTTATTAQTMSELGDNARAQIAAIYNTGASTGISYD